MCPGRPPWRSGRTVLVATVLTAACAAPNALAAPPFRRDRTPLPASLGRGTAGAVASGGSGTGTVVRTIVGLAVVLAVIYGVYWLLKTYARTRGGKGDGRLEILATTPLAQNRALHLVLVGDELVLVGSAEQSVTGIRVYSPDESERLREQLEGLPDPLRPMLSPPARSSTSWGGFVDELRRRTARG